MMEIIFIAESFYTDTPPDGSKRHAKHTIAIGGYQIDQWQVSLFFALLEQSRHLSTGL